MPIEALEAIEIAKKYIRAIIENETFTIDEVTQDTRYWIIVIGYYEHPQSSFGLPPKKVQKMIRIESDTKQVFSILSKD
jgi:hypothetical protein